MLALTRLEYGLEDGALEAAERAIAIAPQDAEAHALRGRAFAALLRPVEASYAYEKAVHYAPDDADSWLGLGRALRQARRMTDARSALTRAIALDGEGPLAQEARGLLAKIPP